MAKRIRSAQKRARQSEVRRVRNASVKTGVKSLRKKVLLAVDSGDTAAARESLAKATPVIAKAAAKGVIHKRNAARKISRLTKKVNAMAREAGN